MQVGFAEITFIPSLLTILACCNAMLAPERIVVSTSIDANSWEIQYEALRMLISLQLYGGSLRLAKRAVCISHEGSRGDPDIIDPKLMSTLKDLNITCIDYSVRYSLPTYSPSLNKLCSFTPSCMEEGDYLLYLDADVFVASDPLPSLSACRLHGNILCGRPWNTFPNIQGFADFVGIPTDSGFLDIGQYGVMETFAGGRTYYGMCNTGVYFMPANVSHRLLQRARYYLARASSEQRFSSVVPYAPSYFGIDSVILWAAQHSLNFTIALLPPTLNFMVAAESFIIDGFLSRPETQCDASEVVIARRRRHQCEALGNQCNVLQSIEAESDVKFPVTIGEKDSNKGTNHVESAVNEERGGGTRSKGGSVTECDVTVESTDDADDAGGKPNDVSTDSPVLMLVHFSTGSDLVIHRGIQNAVEEKNTDEDNVNASKAGSSYEDKPSVKVDSKVNSEENSASVGLHDASLNELVGEELRGSQVEVGPSFCEQNGVDYEDETAANAANGANCINKESTADKEEQPSVRHDDNDGSSNSRTASEEQCHILIKGISQGNSIVAPQISRLLQTDGNCWKFLAVLGDMARG